MVTIAGIWFGALLAGSIVTETVFAYPGLGRTIVGAIMGRDYAVVQGGLLLAGFLLLVMSLIVDLTYALLDPADQGSVGRDEHGVAAVGGAIGSIRRSPPELAPIDRRGRAAADRPCRRVRSDGADALRPDRPRPRQSPCRAESGIHPLGTDEVGRDIWSRLLSGLRPSLVAGLAAVAVAAISGTFFGLTSGYFGGVYAAVVMRIMDVLLAWPTIFLALAIVLVFGPGQLNVILAIAVAETPTFARLIRSVTIQHLHAEHVEAARSMGATGPRIMRIHILPFAVDPARRPAGDVDSPGRRRGGIAELPRAGRRGSHAVVGRHGQHGAGLPRAGSDVCRLPGRDHRRHGAGSDPPGGRTAGRPRSAAQRRSGPNDERCLGSIAAEELGPGKTTTWRTSAWDTQHRVRSWRSRT